MKTSDVILQLMATLPRYTDLFTEKIQIIGATKAGLVGTFETSEAHPFSVGSLVNVTGTRAPIEVSEIISETATQVRIRTATDHDYTLNESIPSDQGQQVQITGAGFNESYTLTSVPNRLVLVLERVAQPALPGGTLYVQDQILNAWNGFFQVTAVPTPTTFSVSLQYDLPAPNNFDDSFVYGGFRISGAVDIDVILDSYTAQLNDKLWAFVVLNDFTANKERNNPKDSFAVNGRQMDYRQTMIAPFSIYVFVPNKGDVLQKANARFARDLIEDVRRPIFRSVLGINFETDLDCQGQDVVTYAGDGFFQYNGSYYVHQFNFEQNLDITFDDTAIEELDRAFRDIKTIHENQFSDLTTYEALVNLDEDPDA